MPEYPNAASNELLCSFQNSNSSAVTAEMDSCSNCHDHCTSRSESVYGNGLNTTALTTLKMAVLAPMPSASVMIAIAVKAGRFINNRMP